MDPILLQAQLRASQRRQWFWLGVMLAAFYTWEFVEHAIIPLLTIGPWNAEVVEWAILPIIGLVGAWLYLRTTSRMFLDYAQQCAAHEASERQLAQLEAVHATARMVAHEVNQPLTTIKGYAELMLEQPVDQRTDADLHTIVQAVDRAANHIITLQRATRYVTTPYTERVPMLDLSAQPDTTAPPQHPME